MQQQQRKCCAIMRIGTRFGVRLEQLGGWVSADNDVVLVALNGFCFCTSEGVRVRVGAWGADTSSVMRASEAKMLRPVTSALCYDGSCSEPDTSGDDERRALRRGLKNIRIVKKKKRKDRRRNATPQPLLKTATSMLKRMAFSVDSRKRRRRRRCCRNRCLLQPAPSSTTTARNHHVDICLTDAVDDVLYVWIISFPNGSPARTPFSPHPFCPLTVENCCGSCKGLFDVDFRRIREMAIPRKTPGA